MARPEKARVVSDLPRFKSFICQDKRDHGGAVQGKIFLSVEEYEVIRLLDYEGKTQEECAAAMEVSRGTIQVLYAEARKKIARHFIEGMALEVDGGNYKVCEKKCCQMREKYNGKLSKNKMNNGGKRSMRIAVTYEDGQVFQHFGHTAQFKVYEVENGVITSTQIVDTNGQGHGALAGFLFNGGVDVLICGGIGGGARNALAEAGITLYPGAHGDADEQVRSLIAGKLQYDPNTMCEHHSHEEGHSCGEHSCSNHSCH